MANRVLNAPDPKEVFATGLSFLAAADTIARSQHVPHVTNAAFALELLLKALVLLESNRYVNGHRLKELFDNLLPESQTVIRSIAATYIDKIRLAHRTQVNAGRLGGSLPDLDFDSALERSSDAFVEFRYRFQYRTEDLIWTASPITLGVKERIFQLRPEWRPPADNGERAHDRMVQIPRPVLFRPR